MLRVRHQNDPWEVNQVEGRQAEVAHNLGSQVKEEGQRKVRKSQAHEHPIILKDNYRNQLIHALQIRSSQVTVVSTMDPVNLILIYC